MTSCRRLCRLVPSLAVLVLPQPVQSQSFQLLKTAFPGGAVETAGSSFLLRGGVGESGVVGSTSGGSYVLGEGFWSPIFFLNTTDIPATEEAAIEFVNGLETGFPNPFRDEVTLVFTVAEPSLVELRVYDVAGRKVTTLIDDVRLAGRHRVIWTGLDDSGRRIASGVYFCRLRIGSWIETRRMLRLR